MTEDDKEFHRALAGHVLTRVLNLQKARLAFIRMLLEAHDPGMTADQIVRRIREIETTLDTTGIPRSPYNDFTQPRAEPPAIYRLLYHRAKNVTSATNKQVLDWWRRVYVTRTTKTL